jgi:hypothetical protein
MWIRTAARSLYRLSSIPSRQVSVAISNSYHHNLTAATTSFSSGFKLTTSISANMSSGAGERGQFKPIDKAQAQSLPGYVMQALDMS